MQSLNSRVLDKKISSTINKTLTSFFSKYKSLEDFKLSIELDQKKFYTIKISAKLDNIYHEKIVKNDDLKKTFEIATEEFQKNLLIQIAFTNYKSIGA